MAKRGKSGLKPGLSTQTKTTKSKPSSGIEFIEDAEVLKEEVLKVESLLEKNKKILLGLGIALLLAVAGYLGFKSFTKAKEKEAQAAMYDAVFSFEADSLSHALNGQGGNEGLLEIADNYGSTKAGNLANLYAGIALMKEGKFEEAIKHLDKFSANDEVLQARSYVLMGDSYLELGKADDAAKYYKKAVEYKPNKLSTPGYMMKLGLAYQEAGNKAEAVKVYSSLTEKYPASIEAVNGKKYKSKLEAELGGN